MHGLLCRRSIGAQSTKEKRSRIQPHVLDLLVFSNRYSSFLDRYCVESSLQVVAAIKGERMVRSPLLLKGGSPKWVLSMS